MTQIIIPTLTGGVGNRIFQVFAALGYVERNGGEVFFHIEYCKQNPHDCFTNIFSLFPQIKILEGKEVLMNKKISFLKESDSPVTQFDSEIIILQGWFQDEKWLPKNISLNLPTVSFESEYNNSETVFLHVRRGDYLTLRHHYVYLDKYYSTALSKFSHKTPIMVFSNDMEWCKRELSKKYPTVEIWIWAPTNLSDIETLSLMTQCKRGAICANSSFSWLGAYLGARKESNPCYFPSQWFGDKRKTTIYPSWGILLDV